jgi:hypothetical protein
LIALGTARTLMAGKAFVNHARHSQIMEGNTIVVTLKQTIPLRQRSSGVCQENDMLLGQAASLFKERLVRVFQY